MLTRQTKQAPLWRSIAIGNSHGTPRLRTILPDFTRGLSGIVVADMRPLGSLVERLTGQQTWTDLRGYVSQNVVRYNFAFRIDL